jgi:dTDP-4-dehydrorhamnose reductase
MRILLTGPTGQVGSALAQTLPGIGELIAADRSKIELAKAETIRRAVRDAKADVIVNAAAYTAVDQAEKEEALAMAVNRDGPAILAEEAKKTGALLVHFSTDYVFDGEKSSPYVESDPMAPLNAYGRSKLAGEQAIRDSGCRHLIFRTSWVYAATGKNFLLTMLRLAREKKPLRVVDDQRGAPTSNLMLAAAVPLAIQHAKANGVYHMTAGGQTTWYGFARAIFQTLGIAAELTPISTKDYPTPARRPRNSVLDNARLQRELGLRLPSWEQGLREVLQAWKAA